MSPPPKSDHAEHRGTPLFPATHRVFKGEPTPRIGDDYWDLGHLVPTSAGERGFDLTTIPELWRETAREIAAILARPDHPSVVRAGVIRRWRPATAKSLITLLTNFRTFALWATRSGIDSPSDLTDNNIRRFRSDLTNGTHRPGGSPLSPGSARRYLEMLGYLHNFHPALTGGGLPFDPLEGTPPPRLVHSHPTENTTAPLPFDTWARVIRACWFIIDILGPDIAHAEQIRRSLPTNPRGPAGETARLMVEEHLTNGGWIPLHTGVGRSRNERGTVNYRLLARLLGISENPFNRAHRYYDDHLVNRIQHAARQPDTALHGGLHRPTATFPAETGDIAWNAELGTGETEHLTSVLRAAGYLLLAALTAMRDSELQDLGVDAVETADGLTALRSIQHKGIRTPGGMGRHWYAPAPAVRAIEVLGRISPNQSKIFARSDGDSAYLPSRDVRRLIAFVNARPPERIGRGAELPLEPITLHGDMLNQQTMRRSFAVFAARYPEAELGLGIQLGHAALRLTAGYFLDSQQRAARLFDDDRRRVANELVHQLVNTPTEITGPGSEHLHELRALVVNNPERSQRLMDTLADRYHLGALNDCHYRPELSECGTDGPQLAEKRCATNQCGNAVITERHRGAWEQHLSDLDAALDGESLHPVLRQRLHQSRREVHEVIVNLSRPDKTV